MQSFLEFERVKGRRYPYRHSRWLDLMASDGPEQKTILRWCKNARIPAPVLNPQLTLAFFMMIRIQRSDNVLPCEEWEARLWYIALWFGNFQELSEWETAPAEKREGHSLRVAKLARDLANALEEPIRPYYPPALELFDEERAVDIIRSLPEQTAEVLLNGTGYAHDWHPRQGRDTRYQRGEYDRRSYSSDAALNLASRFDSPEPQLLSSMLRRLADLAEQKCREPKRDARPKTANANARAFARHLAKEFEFKFNRTPNDVIAACVCLRFPDLENPPNEDTIRAWRGAR